ncbi:DUF7144 family membrane protein [Streptomyces antibioticus]|uniref:DUF7144 family membrane protein n=1 Tax=Streptomyces antibioticus TaxID=1890 RepID=UPI003D712092
MTPPGASPSGDPHRAPQGDIGTAWSAPPGGPRRTAPAPQDTRRARDARLAGGVAFAGTLMLCGGVLAVLRGIPALTANGGGHPRTGSSAYDVDLAAWGWIHVALGVLAAGGRDREGTRRHDPRIRVVVPDTGRPDGRRHPAEKPATSVSGPAGTANTRRVPVRSSSAPGSSPRTTRPRRPARPAPGAGPCRSARVRPRRRCRRTGSVRRSR